MKNFPSNYEGISNRLRQVIEQEVPTKGRFGWLEEKTGIARNTWQTFYGRSKAIPSGDMIQAVGRLFPKYAFWLATGLTDLAFGHTYPKRAHNAKCFPEIRFNELEMKRFDDYFEHCMAMQMQVYDGSTAQGGMEEQQAANETLESLARLRLVELNMLREEMEERRKQREKTRKIATE